MTDKVGIMSDKLGTTAEKVGIMSDKVGTTAEKVGIMSDKLGTTAEKAEITTEKVGVADKKVGIYIHVPFCRSKCYYCDFCSKSGSDAEMIEAYVDAACREIDAVSAKLREERAKGDEKDGKNGFLAADLREKGRGAAQNVGGTVQNVGGVAQNVGGVVQNVGDVGEKELPIADTVYFGGGTPTLLTVEQFERLISAVERNFGIAEGAEITAEANPKTADREKLAGMRKVGINRLSIGMQSVHDGELRALGRIHSFADFEKIFSDARAVGFDNISADLMYGIPEQTCESFALSVKRLAAMNPEHISSYSLTVEEGTNFYRRRDRLDLPDEDTVAEMYAEMSNILSDHGYNKYEISNFSKIGRESRHNVKYWKYDDYIGIGPAAHSFFSGVRSSHSRDVEAYIRGEDIIDSREMIVGEEAMSEYVMLAMRLACGVDATDFYKRFGVDFYEKFGEKFKKYAPKYLTVDDLGCRFNDEGFFVSNYILSDVLDF